MPIVSHFWQARSNPAAPKQPGCWFSTSLAVILPNAGYTGMGLAFAEACLTAYPMQLQKMSPVAERPAELVEFLPRHGELHDARGCERLGGPGAFEW